MRLPKSIACLTEELQKLPSVGPRTAERLTYFLLRAPQETSDSLASALYNLKRKTVVCGVCFNVAEHNPCVICADDKREQNKLCVVEEPLDVVAIEKTGKYNGRYHVLGGSLNPIVGIGPEELRLRELLARLEKLLETGNSKSETNPKSLVSEIEVILATNPDLEGEATAMFIKKKIESVADGKSDRIKITRIARGLPTGGDLEYADEVTITRALEGRLEF